MHYTVGKSQSVLSVPFLYELTNSDSCVGLMFHLISLDDSMWISSICEPPC